MIAYLIRSSTLWKFLKTRALTIRRHAEFVSASTVAARADGRRLARPWTLKQVQGDGRRVVGVGLRLWSDGNCGHGTGIFA
jgi:hypothetical protein